MEKKKKKQQEKHWYRMYYGECPVCGRLDSYRERVYGEKPKDPKEIYKQVSDKDCYDYCVG
jgi:hypothetical protein